MKLSQWAKQNSVSYRTAWNHFKAGKIQGAYQLSSGTVVVPDDALKEEFTVVYTRVSSSKNKENLKKQSERLVDFCLANGWEVNLIIKEIGSGLNDNRRQLLKILEDGEATRIVVEHKDRLTRFGFRYIEVLCKHINCKLVVVNQAENNEEDLVQDFVSIIKSFCAKIYGQRRGRRKTEKIIEELQK